MVPKIALQGVSYRASLLTKFRDSFRRTKMTGRAKSARLRVARKIINRIMIVNPIPQHARHRKTRRKIVPPVDGFPVDYRLLGLPAIDSLSSMGHCQICPIKML